MIVEPQITQDLSSRNDLNPEKVYTTVYITDGEILDEIASKSWNYQEAISVIRCESSFDFYAISKTGDYCGFQINQIHFPEFPEGTYEEKVDWILNPINCINFAFKLYQEKKWGPWFKSEKCWKPLFD